MQNSEDGSAEMKQCDSNIPDRLCRPCESLAGAVSTIVPTVVKKTTYGERGYDIFSRLLEDRIIFIGSIVDDVVANLVNLQFD